MPQCEKSTCAKTKRQVKMHPRPMGEATIIGRRRVIQEHSGVAPEYSGTPAEFQSKPKADRQVTKSKKEGRSGWHSRPKYLRFGISTTGLKYRVLLDA